MKVLLVFAHPALERSRVNRRLFAAASEVTGVTTHDLYEAYPDLDVDVDREQALLAAHDAVVFQHPFYWYSTPALLKQWQDLVLEHGWAYGHDGRALEGKLTFNALSAGGPESAYQHGGHNAFTVRELLAPWEATARLCRMRYLAPFVVFSALRVAGPADVEPHARLYAKLLRALVEDRLDLVKAAEVAHLGAALDELVQVGAGSGRTDAAPGARAEESAKRS